MSAYAFFSLIFVHTERMINDYGGWHLGVNTAFMVQCSHLCTLGWDFCDFEIPIKERNSEQKKYAFEQIPSILEFFAAALNPAQSFSGPSSNFKDFRDFINLTGDFSAIPSTLFPCFKRFSIGAAGAFIYVIMNSNFPVDILKTPEYKHLNIFTRVLLPSYYNIVPLHELCSCWS